MQSDHQPEAERPASGEQARFARALVWIGFGVGVAVIGSAIAYTAFRLASAGRREDPTTARIQELIDEANSLLKALDDQRHSA